MLKVKSTKKENSVHVLASCDGAFLSGQYETVVNGVASFKIIFLSCPIKSCSLIFTADGGAWGFPVDGKNISTDPVTVNALSGSGVRFDQSSYLSFSTITVTKGVTLQPTAIRMTDSCGEDDTSITGISITATTDSGTLGGKTTSTVTFGVAVFDGLSFSTSPPSGRARITFTVDPSATIHAAGTTLTTGVITVLPDLIHDYNIRFKPTASLVTSPGQSFEMVVNKPPSTPLLIEMIDSAGNFDNNNNGIVITATGTADITNYTATVTRGVANFSSFSFRNCHSGNEKLTFIVGPEGNTPAVNKKISTGSVFVVGVNNSAIKFANTGLITAEGMSKQVDPATKLPPIYVRIDDGCGNTDETATDMVVYVVAGTTGRISGSLDVAVVNGVAKFDNLMFTSLQPRGADLTFTARAPNRVVNEMFIVSGDLTPPTPPPTPAPPTAAPTPAPPPATTPAPTQKSNTTGGNSTTNPSNTTQPPTRTPTLAPTVTPEPTSVKPTPTPQVTVNVTTLAPNSTNQSTSNQTTTKPPQNTTNVSSTPTATPTPAKYKVSLEFVVKDGNAFEASLKSIASLIGGQKATTSATKMAGSLYVYTVEITFDAPSTYTDAQAAITELSSPKYTQTLQGAKVVSIRSASPLGTLAPLSPTSQDTIPVAYLVVIGVLGFFVCGMLLYVFCIRKKYQSKKKIFDDQKDGAIEKSLLLHEEHKSQREKEDGTLRDLLQEMEMLNHKVDDLEFHNREIANTVADIHVNAAKASQSATHQTHAQLHTQEYLADHVRKLETQQDIILKELRTMRGLRGL
eukprot:PhF_6_TR31860/c0_g1_i1/m.47269